VTELEHACEVCKAKKGEVCRNVICPGEPLPGQEFHEGRVERVYCQGCGMPHRAVETCGRTK